MRGRFVHADARYTAWFRRAIDAAFENHILTGAVINSKHINPCQFFEDAREIVLDRVQDVLQEQNALKINTVFNGEFIAGDKSASKNIAARNYDHFHSDLRE